MINKPPIISATTAIVEFLDDRQCCTKCLKKGIRVPYLESRAHYSNGFDKRPGRRGRWNNPMRWCQACWQARHRRSQECDSREKAKRLRYAEWEARALMSKEERQRTPMVHIPVGRIAGPNKGKLRHPLTYLGMYGRYRSRFYKRLLGIPINYGCCTPASERKPISSAPAAPPPKSRHNVLPTS